MPLDQESEFVLFAYFLLFTYQPFNVLKYENMQHYDSHMGELFLIHRFESLSQSNLLSSPHLYADSFDPKQFGPQPSQRIATVLVYLSDVDEGGETVFKKEGLHGVLSSQRVMCGWTPL